MRKENTGRTVLKSGAIAASVVITGIVVSACSTSEENILSEHGLEGMDAREIIDHLDRQPLAERPAGLLASVKAEELLVSNQDAEISLEMPANFSYISVAPFVSNTHECFYHSLTTCTGELGNESMDVAVIDGETGEALYEGATTTFDNGFVGFWVPRGSFGTISVNYQGLEGESEFATGEEDPTCITDLRLT